MPRLRTIRTLLSDPELVGLLLRAWIVVAAVRVSLHLVPSRMVLRAARRLASPRIARPSESAGDAARIVRAVRSMSRRVPSATCLTQALAGQIMLGRHGHASTLRIGVASDHAGRIRAHAWLETSRGIVLGGEERSRFTALPDLDPAL